MSLKQNDTFYEHQLEIAQEKCGLDEVGLNEEREMEYIGTEKEWELHSAFCRNAKPLEKPTAPNDTGKSGFEVLEEAVKNGTFVGLSKECTFCNGMGTVELPEHGEDIIECNCKLK